MGLTKGSEVFIQLLNSKLSKKESRVKICVTPPHINIRIELAYVVSHGLVFNKMW